MNEERKHEDSNKEGLPSTAKVVAGAALGLAVPAAVGAARKLISADDDSERSEDAAASSRVAKQSGGTRTSSPRKAATRPKTGAATRRKTGTASRRVRTKEQLYRQATRLKIDGRSQMTKAELERAVGRATKKR
jgi:hypothetical protein